MRAPCRLGVLTLLVGTLALATSARSADFAHERRAAGFRVSGAWQQDAPAPSTPPREARAPGVSVDASGARHYRALWRADGATAPTLYGQEGAPIVVWPLVRFGPRR